MVGGSRLVRESQQTSADSKSDSRLPTTWYRASRLNFNGDLYPRWPNVFGLMS
jgi:hypothetical protein